MRNKKIKRIFGAVHGGPNEAAYSSGNWSGNGGFFFSSGVVYPVWEFVPNVKDRARIEEIGIRGREWLIRVGIAEAIWDDNLDEK